MHSNKQHAFYQRDNTPGNLRIIKSRAVIPERIGINAPIISHYTCICCRKIQEIIGYSTEKPEKKFIYHEKTYPNNTFPIAPE